MTCLTTAFRRCPRLVGGARLEKPPQASGESPPPGDERAQPLVASSPATQEQAHAAPVEGALQARPDPQYTELQTVRHRTARQAGEGGHSSVIEFAILGLVVAIVLALAFTGYAVVYRLRVGPGLASAQPLAQPVESQEVELPATLVPTFTPTPVPAPTLAAPTLVVEPPTPSPEPTPPTPTPPARPIADSPPTRLVIAKISLDIPVVPVGIKTVRENGRSRAIWADVPNAGGFHETSALPGQQGNTVINGHRDILGSVFRHLDQVEVGDEIVLYAGDVAYPYRVTETMVVPETFASAKQRAENLRLIGTMPEERLTLVTCTPVGLATHRLLVVARPPEQASPEMPEAGSGHTP